MTKRTKNYLMVGGGLAGLWLYLKRKKKYPNGAMAGGGIKGVASELDAWFNVFPDGSTKGNVRNELLPGITDGDLAAYAAGNQYGTEPSGYTQQDEMLIEQA